MSKIGQEVQKLWAKEWSKTWFFVIFGTFWAVLAEYLGKYEK
jgi:hypothetical protein